jgi:hypothetical protein
MNSNAPDQFEDLHVVKIFLPVASPIYGTKVEPRK